MALHSTVRTSQNAHVYAEQVNSLYFFFFFLAWSYILSKSPSTTLCGRFKADLTHNGNTIISPNIKDGALVLVSLIRLSMHCCLWYLALWSCLFSYKSEKWWEHITLAQNPPFLQWAFKWPGSFYKRVKHWDMRIASICLTGCSDWVQHYDQHSEVKGYIYCGINLN